MWKERSPGINPVGCCDYSGGEKLVTKMSKKDERKLLLNDVFAEYSLVLQV